MAGIANDVVNWLAWGFFMGIGWAVGTWLIAKVLK
jgi:hypothetical protein